MLLGHSTSLRPSGASSDQSCRPGHGIALLTGTWDQGKELALHADVAHALGMPVFFCDPRSPWQRPSHENTNGLLRQYFPKGSDLRVHGPEQLTAVAAELNDQTAQES
jgi:IS30 family transposase